MTPTELGEYRSRGAGARPGDGRFSGGDSSASVSEERLGGEIEQIVESYTCKHVVAQWKIIEKTEKGGHKKSGGPRLELGKGTNGICSASNRVREMDPCSALLDSSHTG